MSERGLSWKQTDLFMITNNAFERGKDKERTKENEKKSKHGDSAGKKISSSIANPEGLNIAAESFKRCIDFPYSMCWSVFP